MTSRVPKLSVVIPTFNNEEVLRRCLTSWQLSAATSGVEIIVVEDGCRDGTRAFLESGVNRSGVIGISAGSTWTMPTSCGVPTPGCRRRARRS